MFQFCLFLKEKEIINVYFQCKRYRHMPRGITEHMKESLINCVFH